MRRPGLLAILAILAVPLVACGDREAPRQSPGAAAFEVPAPYELTEWSADASPLASAEGRLVLGGEPVVGARIKVSDYLLWAPTDADGHFEYPLDVTLAHRYAVSVADAERATIDGEELTSEERAALDRARGWITVGNQLSELETASNSRGQTVVSGIVTLGDEPVQPVTLTAYELTGEVTDARGRPVPGAIVSTRTTDRDFWTFSEPSDSNGRYHSNFAASDRIASDPVPITIHVAVGDQAYAFLPDETVSFDRLKSARMDISLPPAGYPPALPAPHSYPGARYQGVLVGASVDGRAVRPLRVTWPDERGRFELTLPADLSGRTVSLWAGELELFSRRPARPGGPVDLARWPDRLPPELPRDLTRVELSG
ncbi:MAG: hypothetical protein GEU88_11025 [Solirubrobacterales bacterium]|nr:hypothetical protein [Solirubrobacterales bacterium]